MPTLLSDAVPADAPTVTSDDLHYISNPAPDAPSPYHGVYPGKGRSWEARAYKRRVGGPEPTPRAAAVKLIRWWKQRYGTRWRAAWAYRQTTGWTAMRCRGGVWALAEVCGQAVVTVGVGPDGRACDAVATPGSRPFPDRTAAAEGVRAWAEREWGADGRYRVRRTWAPDGRRATR